MVYVSVKKISNVRNTYNKHIKRYFDMYNFLSYMCVIDQKRI